jgi:hypothetical protein
VLVAAARDHRIRLLHSIAVPGVKRNLAPHSLCALLRKENVPSPSNRRTRRLLSPRSAAHTFSSSRDQCSLASLNINVYCGSRVNVSGVVLVVVPEVSFLNKVKNPRTAQIFRAVQRHLSQRLHIEMRCRFVPSAPQSTAMIFQSRRLHSKQRKASPSGEAFLCSTLDLFTLVRPVQPPAVQSPRTCPSVRDR